MKCRVYESVLCLLLVFFFQVKKSYPLRDRVHPDTIYFRKLSNYHCCLSYTHVDGLPMHTPQQVYQSIQQNRVIPKKEVIFLLTKIILFIHVGFQKEEPWYMHAQPHTSTMDLRGKKERKNRTFSIQWGGPKTLEIEEIYLEVKSIFIK